MFRLQKKQAGNAAANEPVPDAGKLIAEQSLTAAVIAGALFTLILCGLWAVATVASGKIFPWFSVVQGALVGMVVRHYGRGLDWRFPLLAAVMAFTGAFIGNLLIAVPTTSSELQASPLDILRGLTWMSFRIFFGELMSAVDYIYAAFAAAVASFYSKRLLNRREVYALRTMRKTECKKPQS